MRMRSQPFHMICNRVECHHTGKYTVNISAIAVFRQLASLTRCLRRLHRLHAKFTRDFLGVDVDGPDAVRTAPCPCCSETGSVIVVAT